MTRGLRINVVMFVLFIVVGAMALGMMEEFKSVIAGSYGLAEGKFWWNWLTVAVPTALFAFVVWIWIISLLRRAVAENRRHWERQSDEDTSL